MPAYSITDRLGVCAWSLQPTSANDLFDKLALTGISNIQIGLDQIRGHPADWDNFMQACAQRGVTCVSGMLGTLDEDYTTLDTIRRTGGLVPDLHWEENWRNFTLAAGLAQGMGLKLVSFHAGFLPHEESDPSFGKLLDRAKRLAELFADRGITLGLETGQETAETLRMFLEKLNFPNVGVNFDPANMILYDKGDPIAALRVLGPYLKQCHIKDARRTKVPGTWGEEVVVGTGEVDWRAFFGVLGDLAFKGWGCIEREVGNQRVADIRAAREYVERLAGGA